MVSVCADCLVDLAPRSAGNRAEQPFRKLVNVDVPPQLRRAMWSAVLEKNIAVAALETRERVNGSNAKGSAAASAAGNLTSTQLAELKEKLMSLLSHILDTRVSEAQASLAVRMVAHVVALKGPRFYTDGLLFLTAPFLVVYGRPAFAHHNRSGQGYHCRL